MVLMLVVLFVIAVVYMFVMCMAIAAAQGDRMIRPRITHREHSPVTYANLEELVGKGETR